MGAGGPLGSVVFAIELAPARGDRARLGGRALDAQHDVGHRLQPLRPDGLAARVAQPIRAVVELGQRTLRALQTDLQRRADPDLGESADRLDRAVPNPLTEALRRATLGALGERRYAAAELVAVRLEVTPDRIEVGHVPETLERTELRVPILRLPRHAPASTASRAMQHSRSIDRGALLARVRRCGKIDHDEPRIVDCDVPESREPGHPRTLFDHVADDVDWTVEGTNPLAGRYLSKQAFLDATFGRLAGVLSDGVHLDVEHVFVDGDTAIVELYSTSTTSEGAPFANRYC